MIKIHLFASLSEKMDCSHVHLDYSGENTVDEIKQSLVAKDRTWDLLNESTVLVAVNQTFAQGNAKINDGDEIAFFPPVTGG